MSYVSSSPYPCVGVRLVSCHLCVRLRSLFSSLLPIVGSFGALFFVFPCLSFACLPAILHTSSVPQPPSFFVSYIFDNLVFHSDHVSNPFHPALVYFSKLCKPFFFFFFFFFCLLCRAAFNATLSHTLVCSLMKSHVYSFIRCHGKMQ